MKIRQILSIGCFLWILASLRLAAQQPEIQPLPIDPKIRYGQLNNGLTYYIRHNAQPKDRADFFIAQNVGSILEDENQRGLAHFLEHMELTDQLVFLETAVPRPEGLAPPLVAGIAKRSVKRIIGQRRRLFGAIASAAGQQHDGRNGRP